ncbi:MAG: hypothetical protein U9Q03_04665 [Patescibacteria group bacterium]|nr:hypothetical protein [Patescibacteria group bacterium]
MSHDKSKPRGHSLRDELENSDGAENLEEVFTRYITKKGKRIYRKDGKVFHFFVRKKRP